MTQTINIIYVGTQLTRHNKQISERSAQSLTAAAERRASECFGGYSRSLIEGGWIDQKPGQPDTVVRERSMRWEIVTDARETPAAEIDDFAEYLRMLFEQDTVIVSSYEVKTRYITRTKETKAA